MAQTATEATPRRRGRPKGSNGRRVRPIDEMRTDEESNATARRMRQHQSQRRHETGDIEPVAYGLSTEGRWPAETQLQEVVEAHRRAAQDTLNYAYKLWLQAIRGAMRFPRFDNR